MILRKTRKAGAERSRLLCVGIGVCLFSLADDFWVAVSFNHQMTDGAFCYPIDAVVNQGIGSRHIDFEFNNRRPGGRHQGGLNVLAGRAANSPFGINLIKDFPRRVFSRLVFNLKPRFFYPFGPRKLWSRITATTQNDPTISRSSVVGEPPSTPGM